MPNGHWAPSLGTAGLRKPGGSSPRPPARLSGCGRSLRLARGAGSSEGTQGTVPGGPAELWSGTGALCAGARGGRRQAPRVLDSTDALVPRKRSVASGGRSPGCLEPTEGLGTGDPVVGQPPYSPPTVLRRVSPPGDDCSVEDRDQRARAIARGLRAQALGGLPTPGIPSARGTMPTGGALSDGGSPIASGVRSAARRESWWPPGLGAPLESGAAG